MITLSVLITSLLTWLVEQLAGPLLALVGIKIGSRAKESAVEQTTEVVDVQKREIADRPTDAGELDRLQRGKFGQPK